MYTCGTELTFKRAFCTPATRSVTRWRLFFERNKVDLFIYSDESGVFDHVHNRIFVFAWLVFLGKPQKNEANFKYANAERTMIKKYNSELKANKIKNRDKNKLFRTLNSYKKGAIVINQDRILSSCYSDKKTKQRYLDYAFKIGVKKHLEFLINRREIAVDEIENIFFFPDEHSTATNGLYELGEGLLQELKYGTHNWNYNIFFPPIFPKIKNLQVSYCDSKKSRLVRCADIVANKVFFHATKGTLDYIEEKVFIHRLP